VKDEFARVCLSPSYRKSQQQASHKKKKRRPHFRDSDIQIVVVVFEVASASFSSSSSSPTRSIHKRTQEIHDNLHVMCVCDTRCKCHLTHTHNREINLARVVNIISLAQSKSDLSIRPCMWVCVCVCRLRAVKTIFTRTMLSCSLRREV